MFRFVEGGLSRSVGLTPMAVTTADNAEAETGRLKKCRKGRPWSPEQAIQHRQGQRQPLVLHQLGHLPTGDNAYLDACRLSCGNSGLVLRFELWIAIDPPDPDVGVQQHQRSASHSSGVVAGPK